MSLWYESLALCLNDCNEKLPEKAKCIIAYLSMPVPRSWWEEAMKTGRVHSNQAQVLHNLRIELSKVANLGDQLSSGLLMALAFINDDTERVLWGRFGQVDNQHFLDDYLAKPEKNLADVPSWLCGKTGLSNRPSISGFPVGL